MFHDFLLCGPETKSLVQSRIKIFLFFVIFGFLTVSLRLCWVSLSGTYTSNTLPAMIPQLGMRRSIVDRNGLLLASSLQTFSLGARCRKLQNIPEILEDLHPFIPHLSKENLRKRLSSSKPFVWLARHLSPQVRYAIQALGIEGLEFIKEQKRFYPCQSLFSHILGFTDVEQQGISGLEKSLNEVLDEKDGPPVRLSLDARIQYIVHQELSRTIEMHKAVGGNAILVNLKTGEILAMVSLPDFNPNEHIVHPPETLFNRNTTGVYEFGSILKIHNMALFLSEKKGTLNSVFDASRPLCIGRFRVTDFMGKNRPMTVREGFLYSSNIVNGSMAIRVGPQAQWRFFKDLGFMDTVPLELAENAKPLFPRHWSNARSITASYGYGFAITPLHMIWSLQNLISGRKVSLTLLYSTTQKPNAPRSGAVPPDVSRILIQLLKDAAHEGQAQKAQSTSCCLGAKTGTANALIKGRYQKGLNLTSCVSIFPIPNPEYVMLVSVDRAQPSEKTHYFATAGWIAAPLTKSIVDRIAAFLHLVSPQCVYQNPSSPKRIPPSSGR